MVIIPAIDIRGGKCVRLFQGDYEKETIYGDDPVAMAGRWIEKGARHLHLVDLDGARQGTPRNREIILQIIKASSVPVQVGGGIRKFSDIKEYLAAGAAQVILGTAAYLDPRFLQDACRLWPGKIAVDVAAKDGMAAISGWTQETGARAVDLAQKCEALGAARIIYTDILRDGAQKGINLENTRILAQSLKIPVIASGGISSLADVASLLPLEADGVWGVIVGRALYAGTLDLREAIFLGGEKNRK